MSEFKPALKARILAAIAEIPSPTRAEYLAAEARRQLLMSGHTEEQRRREGGELPEKARG